MNKLIVIAVLIVCASVSYYYAVALPEHQAQKLALEREKVEMERQQEEAKRTTADAAAIIETERKNAFARQLTLCRATVDGRYDEYLKINGTHKGNGIYSYSAYIGDELRKIKIDGYADCDRTYGYYK